MSSLLFGNQQPVMQSPAPNIGQSLAASAVNAPLQGPMSPAGPSTGGFFSNLANLGNAVGDFLGGTGGQLIGTGLTIDELNKITDIAQRSAAEQAAIGREAQEASAFKPFTVSTGFGSVAATPTGGYTTTLSPAMAAQQQALQGITSGLLGGMGGIGGMQSNHRAKLPAQPPVDEQERRNAIQDYLSFYKRDQQPPVGQLQGSSGPNPPSLQEVLAGRGFTMPEKPTGVSHMAMVGFKDPVTGKFSMGGAHEAGHASLLSDFYGQNPEALELAKQYQADPFQFGGKPSPIGSIGSKLGQTLQPPQAPMAPSTGGLIGALQPPQAPTAPSTGGFGAGIPDVSGIQQQALGGVGGFLTGAMAPMAQREADVYERIRATQRPEEQRAQLALEERLAAQGRTGLRTAQFGGSPEQFALAQAQEEAKARASLGALGQAQAEQLQQMGLAESLFGLGGKAAGLPQALQAGQLGNIGAAMGLQYLPEQQLLNTLTPAISLADIAGTGQRQGAGYMSQAGISGLEDILQAETVRSQNLRDIYSTILGAQANQQAANTAAATNTGLFSSIGNIGNAIVDLFT